jgi:segregation and condensation protein A
MTPPHMSEVENSEYPRGFTPTPDSQSPLYQLRLDNFAGPLDLLLHLIKKHDVDIFDIPLAFVTARYLESLDTLSDLDIDIAAGFLTLAAELLHMKSKMLVPQPESAGDNEEDDIGDPRAELVRRLLEYQKYKDAGERLSGREVLGRDSFARTVKLDETSIDGFVEGNATLEEIPIFRLIEALDRLLKKGKLEIKHHVVVETLSVADRLQALIDKLRQHTQLEFSALFEGLVTKRQIILTFLALLEVTKLKLVRIHQVEGEGEIYIRAIHEKLAELEGNPAGLKNDEGKGLFDEYR